MLSRQLAGGTLLAVPENGTCIGRGGTGPNGVSACPGHMEADSGVHDIGHSDKSVERTGDQGDSDERTLVVLKHPDGDCEESEQGQRLVGPGEVAPQNVETVGGSSWRTPG